jgi:hypothetical protein
MINLTILCLPLIALGLQLELQQGQEFPPTSIELSSDEKQAIDEQIL